MSLKKIILAMALLSGCSDLPHEGAFDPQTAVDKQAKGSVAGYFTLDGENDATGISVQLQGTGATYSGLTGADGSFQIAGIAPGIYRLTAVSRYFEAFEQSIEVRLGEPLVGIFAVLAAKKTDITGNALAESLRNRTLTTSGLVQVTLERTGSLRSARLASPGPGLFVRASGVTPLSMTAVSSVDGAYNFTGVPAGQYSLVASSPGLPPATVGEIEVTGEDGPVVIDDVVLRLVSGFVAVTGAGVDATGRFTSNPNVRLLLTGFNANEMRIGESLTPDPEDCVPGAAQTYAVAANLVLSGEGTHMFCVQYIGDDGHASEIAVESIVFDQSPPLSGSVALAGGTTVSASGLLSVSLSASDVTSGVALLRISEDPAFTGVTPQAFVNSKAVAASAGDGPKTFYASFGDKAGNFSAPVSFTAVVDRTDPVVTLFQIEDAFGNGLTLTRSNSVVLHVEAADSTALTIKIGDQADLSASPWLPLQNTLAWNLPPSALAQGEARTVFARIRDAAGHEIQVQTPAVILDTKAPTNPGISALAATHSTQLQVQVSALNADWAEVSADIGFQAPLRLSPAGSTTVTLSGGDGAKIVYARFGDGAGNLSPIVSHSVIVDTTPPVLAAFTVNEGEITNQSLLHLALTALDAAAFRVGVDACAGAWIPFASSYAFALPETSPGAKVIAVQMRDAVGNVSGCLTRSVLYDPAPPQFTAAQPLTINGDAVYTTERSVTVALAVTGATEIKLSESAALFGAAWLPYSPTINWTFGAGEGVRRIYFKARDAAGNETAIQNDGIEVDTVAPAFNSVSAAAVGKNRTVSLALTGSGAASMRISEDALFAAAAWLPYAGAATFFVSPGDGSKTVFVQLADAAGNQSLVRSVGTWLDQAAPARPLVSLVGGVYTRNSTVTLQIVAGDASQVLLSQWAPMTDATWQPYGLIKTFTLAGADAALTVYVRVRDDAGNESDAAAAAVTLDTTAPSISLFQAEDGDGNAITATRLLGYNLRLDAGPDASPLTVQYSTTNLFAGIPPEPVESPRPWSVLPAVNPLGEVRSAYARLVDAAGNETVAGPVSVLVDTVAPSNVELSAPALVSSTTVALQLQATAADWVELADDVSFLLPQRFSMRPVTSYTLIAGDGGKAVYARFADQNGNYSAIVSASVELDTTPPSAAAFVIEEAPLTPLLNVHLQLAAADAVEMQISENNCGGVWSPFSSEAATTFQSSLDGVKTIAVRFRDAAGNPTACLTQTITLDTTVPFASGVTPRSGVAGTEVVINGVNFGAAQGSTYVQIGTGRASVLSWTNTELHVLVPADASPGFQSLRVISAGGASFSTSFNVYPTITYLLPGAVVAGENLILHGLNFGGLQAAGSVEIGGVNADIVAWSQNAVTVAVPVIISSGMNAVVVEAGGNVSNSAMLAVAPVLDSVTPMLAVTGATVTLQGSHFGSAQGAGQVLFAGAPAQVSAWSGTSIVAVVPSFAQAGTVAVQVVAGFVPSRGVNIEISRPWIDAVAPGSATAGTFLTLRGKFFGAMAGAVWVEGFSAPVSAWSESQVVVEFPAGVTAGSHAVTVATAAGAVSNQRRVIQRGSNVWLGTLEGPRVRSESKVVWTGSEMFIYGTTTNRVTASRYNPSTNTWTPVSDTGNPLKTATALVWTGSEVIVWGGNDPFFGSGTTTGARYSIAKDAWLPTAVDAATPSYRMEHGAVWTGREMMVWGGFGGGMSQDGGGLYNPVEDSWRPVTTAAAPEGRARHAMVWTGTEVLVWGGTTQRPYPNGCCETVYLNSGGRYFPDQDLWLPLAGVNAPTGRQSPFAAWTGTELVVWGGGVQYNTVGSGGRYFPSTDRWFPMASLNAPTPRENGSTVWTGNEVVIWGGKNNSADQNTGGRYNPRSDVWTATSTNGGALTGASGHGAVWTGSEMLTGGSVHYRYTPQSDSWSDLADGVIPLVESCRRTAVWTGSEMIVWGGIAKPNSTGYRYNPVSDSWLPLAVDANTPARRCTHTAVWAGDAMVVFGGYTSDGSSNYPAVGGGRYYPATNSWLPMSLTNIPTSRSMHHAVWTGAEVLIFGGYAADAGRYDPVADTWATMTMPGWLTDRIEATAVWTGTQLLFWGGRQYYGAYTRYDNGGSYDPVSDTWSYIGVVANTPIGRYAHSAVWNGDHMIVWAGCGWSGYLSDGARYYPADNTWTSIAFSANAPSARCEHTAVLTPTEMIVWGEWNTNTGSKLNLATGVWSPMSMVDAPPRGNRIEMFWTGSDVLLWNDFESFSTPVTMKYVP